MPATKVSTSEASPFNRFARHHEAVNRWFRSTEVALRFARMEARKLDSALPVAKLFPGHARRKDTLKQYKGRFVEEGRAPRASIRDFLLDLGDGWLELLEAVIVNEVGGLELFLREWLILAIQNALANSPKSAPRIKDLEGALHELISNPYRTTSMRRICTIFPPLDAVLSCTTHLRATHPLLSPSDGALSCQSVADLWRDVRNLILHHDRIVHKRFYDSYSQVWSALQKDAFERGKKIAPRPCEIGAPLPIVVRHAVFCLTSCYQTAVVLHMSALASEPVT